MFRQGQLAVHGLAILLGRNEAAISNRGKFFLHRAVFAWHGQQHVIFMRKFSLPKHVLAKWNITIIFRTHFPPVLLPSNQSNIQLKNQSLPLPSSNSESIGLTTRWQHVRRSIMGASTYDIFWYLDPIPLLSAFQATDKYCGSPKLGNFSMDVMCTWPQSIDVIPPNTSYLGLLCAPWTQSEFTQVVILTLSPRNFNLNVLVVFSLTLPSLEVDVFHLGTKLNDCFSQSLWNFEDHGPN